ncbi:penicillin-binding protein 1B [Alkalimonas collagenimarina]|uniref:Penicillin-binding protein 1B n=1 Tax=Alkalimonas collagenimarina TaxID=400390 RepID=A0ABT9GYY7_9GAMM|nr:penicillin-binding protein 1B [Alkalimonas collagenimarina]MDP4536233.1 penicillin-binding protein 1B [Alkalimonas collagenimarina]
MKVPSLKTRLPSLRQAMHYLLWTGLKLSLVLLALVCVYLVYLDSKVTQQFNGPKWQVPAQVYGRSLLVQPDQPLSVTQLVAELELLQYRRVSQITGPGQFRLANQQVEVYRREFDFVDGYQPAERFQVTFAANRVRAIQAEQATEPHFHLEPPLIEHLISPHQEDRELLRLEQTPTLLRDTLLLVEDRDFYRHRGVAPLAIVRAFLVNLTAGRTVQGGSTLTQQLAKNMFLTQDRTLWRKMNEALMALILDFRFSKDAILEAYLNEVYIGQNFAHPVHGFGLGSRFYFAKPINELTVAETALLVGVIKGPSFYDPRRNPERARQRRDLVLRLMFEQHMLDRLAYEQALEEPIALVARGQHRNSRYPAFIALVRQELRQKMRGSVLQQSGLRIFTYLDPVQQQQAELALQQTMQHRAEGLEAAVVVADYHIAAVRAMIGGRDPRYDGFNRAVDTRRQIGSLIKPVIALEALAQPERFDLQTPLQDSPIQLRSNQQDWQPQNFDQQFRGEVSLLDTLVYSYNVPMVRLGLQLGMPQVAAALSKLGLQRRVQLHPSALLGAVELSPLEITQLYQTMANDGVYQSLASIEAVTDQHGTVLYQRADKPIRRYPTAAAELLHFAMQQSVTRGTARVLGQGFPSAQLAGKTGTSSDYRDSWFVSFDGQQVITVWQGRDDNASTGLTGSSGALGLTRAIYVLSPPQP